jgi:hypothetical protein
MKRQIEQDEDVRRSNNVDANTHPVIENASPDTTDEFNIQIPKLL